MSKLTRKLANSTKPPGAQTENHPTWLQQWSMATLHVQKPNLAGRLAGLHMKNRIQLARSRSATLRRESIEIWLDLDKIRQDPASSPRRCCSIDFDQNRHYPTDLKPNQTVFSGGWRRVRFPLTRSGRIGSELGTNPNQAD